MLCDVLLMLHGRKRGHYEFKSKLGRVVLIGTIAQLVERLIRIQEARGSTPLCSIIFITTPTTTSTPPTNPTPTPPQSEAQARHKGILFIIYLNCDDGQRRGLEQQGDQLRPARPDQGSPSSTQDIKATKYKNFNELKLKENIILALTEAGYLVPTPIQ